MIAELVFTGVSVYSPFLSAVIACENSGTYEPGAAKSRSPPFGAEPGSFELFLARSSNFAPAFSWATIALASSSFSTRMWRALYSVPVACALNLSYSFCTSASLTFVVLSRSCESRPIRMLWRASSICALNSADAPRPRRSASWLRISSVTTLSRTIFSRSGGTCWLRAAACF